MAVEIAYGIASGQERVHELDIAHGKKPDNIVLSNASPPVPLLIDFDTARRPCHAYCAPEITRV